MGGFLHFQYFNHAGTSRKSTKHKRHTDGVDAPRNSMECPVGASQNYHAGYDNIPFSREVKRPVAMSSYSSGTPMKKLIDEEMGNRTKSGSTSLSAPSVIARLMGMDDFPSEAERLGTSAAHRNDVLMDQTPRNLSKDFHLRRNKLERSEEWNPNNVKDSSSTPNQRSRATKPRSREHPQEEILQKFKKEFEAWQANKVWERPKLDPSINLRTERLKIKDFQSKEKKAEQIDNNYNSIHQKISETLSYNPRATSNSRTSGMSSYVNKQPQFSIMGDYPTETKAKMVESDNFLITKSAKRNERSSSPTRIVLLKPCSEDENDMEEIWPGSAASVQREVSMEEFLEEVRERLRKEIQGRCNSLTVAGSSSNTFAKERHINPRQLAQNLARQIRESVSSNRGNFLRSDSMRSYKSEVQHQESDMSMFVNKDSERLSSDDDLTVTNGRTKVKDRLRLSPHTDPMKLGKKIGYLEEGKKLTEAKTWSFREEASDVANSKDTSPKNLVRSLSAPVSGAAFSRLLFEDKHVLSETRVRRKRGKESFDFKGRVSNLRQNLGLRNKLFGKRVHLMEEASVGETEEEKTVGTLTPIATNLGTPQENDTEVPPSPASESSDSHDEPFKLPGYPSPNSPLEVPFVVGQEQPSRENLEEEINRNAPEPSPSIVCEDEGLQELVTATDLHDDNDEIIELDDPEEAYVRDVLVTAGVYEREPKGKNTSLRWEALSWPLSRWVFEEVEEIYSHKFKSATETSPLIHSHEGRLDRKVLYDLLNEALREVVKPLSASLYNHKYPYNVTIPYGKRLLESVWNQIQVLTRLWDDDLDCSLESMAAQEVRKALWLVTISDETTGVGAKVERLILEQLLEDIVLELYYD